MLALVRLTKKRNNRIYYTTDYISYELAKIPDIQIQGQDHKEYEWSKVEILRVFNV